MKIKTVVGDFWITADEKGVTETSFQPLPEGKDEENNPYLLQAKKEMDEYFAGKRKEFTVPLSIQTGTEFQREVWAALQTVPYGETCCYQEIGEKIQRPKAVRAIGQANRRNPIPIIIPCHRVIGKDGSMTGYSGIEGIPIKEQLLALERENL